MSPLVPTGRAALALRPAEHAELTGGLWQERRSVNATVSVPRGAGNLADAGNLHNFRRAAGQASGDYRGDYPFQDSDVYKWLEAASWTLASGGDDALRASVAETVRLVAAAQCADGYLNTLVQVRRPESRYEDLQWGHELYCAGHLFQAAVAHARATGSTELLRVATRFADHLDEVFGPGRTEAVGGHPELESALVELYRQTGERRYLTLAGTLTDRRGRGLLGDGRFGRGYWQDHAPLREAGEVAGHAVRQLYLLAGAADVAAESDDRELLDAVVRLWEDMAATKTYLTGGLGAHHRDESFGDAYELPAERAYAETCAAIASVMLSWRLLLATGEARYADLMERTLYNAFLSGVSLDGERYRYVNPLHVREHHEDTTADRSTRRLPWFGCACCPPNVMRLLASLPAYFAATDGAGLTLHQYGSGSFTGRARGEPVTVRVHTGYPWTGEVDVEIAATATAPWTLSLRVPGWCERPAVLVNGTPEPARTDAGWLRLSRAWAPGDTVRLSLPMPARRTVAHPRVDAARGCVAVERGPLVYCFEQVDHADAAVDDTVLEQASPILAEHREGLLGGVTVLTATGRSREDGDRTAWWPYRDADRPGDGPGDPVPLTAVPYYAWGHRGDGAMRVWLPVAVTPAAPEGGS